MQIIFLLITSLLFFTSTFAGTAKSMLMIPLSASSTQEIKKPKTTGKHLTIYLSSKDGHDKNSGQHLSKPIKTLKKLSQIFSESSIEDSFKVYIEKGEYTFDGQFNIKRKVTLQGSSRKETKINLNLGAWDSGIRINHQDVHITSLSILPRIIKREVTKHTGGRAEYGTGITIGNYMESSPHPNVKKVSIKNVDIIRPYLTIGSPGISILGRVSNVEIEDVLFEGTHSTAIVMHWGSYNSFGKSPFIFDGRSYEVYKSYHPNNISIKNIKINKARRAFIVSSCFDISIDQVTGQTSSILTLLPGDEINLYSEHHIKNLVNKNISMKNIDFRINNYSQDIMITASSQGTSKKDGKKRLLDYDNLHLSNIKVSSFRYAESRVKIKSMFNIFRLHGSHISFENIDATALTTEEHQLDHLFAVHRSSNILIKGISGKAKNPYISNQNEDVLIQDISH